jgi:hypothetical protein
MQLKTRVTLVIAYAVLMAGPAVVFFSVLGAATVLHVSGINNVSGRKVLFVLGAFVVLSATAILAERLLQRIAARQTEQNKYALEKAFSQEVERVFTVKSPTAVTFRKRDREDLALLVSTSPPYENAVADFRRQLAEIKDRVEKQKNEIVEVQKIDPVLEATLKVSVENLAKRIETLERKQLEKWDVALVCFAVLSAFGALIGVVLGVAKFVMGY